MELRDLDSDTHLVLEQSLGYLNFSSGAFDPGFHRGLNTIYRGLNFVSAVSRSPRKKSSPSVWQQALRLWGEKLAALRSASDTFRNAEQAAAALAMIEQHIIPAYREFHHDLLNHQSDNKLFGPFMLGRICEALLAEDPTGTDPDEVARRTVARLNDYIGHRPVPALESQKIQPRPHEWLRPVPLFVAEAGTAVGPYQQVIDTAMALLTAAPDSLLRAAHFDPAALDELAMDPRGYDFDHPAHKRPNHHFGEWDPHCIDNKGRYRRFVVREITLQALMSRVTERSLRSIPRAQLLFEAAAVLAGTILMASGVSGSGPDAHDSNTTLMTLIPVIAAYRDRFYEHCLANLEGPHQQRLLSESQKLRQPFGGARQHLNQFVARQRARQLAQVRLSRIFSRMGYVEAAGKQADDVSVASARMLCQIDCSLTAGHLAIRRGDRQTAVSELERVVDLLKRGIDCGAIVDPWNMLGFDGNYSLFPALENSVHDHRVDELVQLMEQIFELYARLWSDAAAASDRQLAAKIATTYEELAHWWHRFAAHEVSVLHATSSLESFAAARKVTEALSQWHLGGAATGDVRFWAPFVEHFDSPRAYAMVVETLLAKGDYVSSRSLLMHWLSHASEVELENAECSFHALARDWVESLIRLALGQVAEPADATQPPPVDEPWTLLSRFFDYLEANAETYGEVPEFELRATDGGESGDAALSALAEDEEEDEDLFGAAYDEVVYKDSTDDGIDGMIFDTSSTTDDALEREAERVVDRLAFLTSVARLWATAGVAFTVAARTEAVGAEQVHAFSAQVRGWLQTVVSQRQALLRLLEQVNAERLSPPRPDQRSMMDYDRQRMVKETLMEQVIASCIEMSDTQCLLLATAAALGEDTATASAEPGQEMDQELADAAGVFAAALAGDRAAVHAECQQLLKVLPKRQILYVPLARQGAPRSIVKVRVRQRIIENLLVVLPRCGLLADTRQLLETARRMERNVPAGRGAVTQFDELFETGCRELVEALVQATNSADEPFQPPDEGAFISHLEKLNEAVLTSWLGHSRTLRLSVVERVRKPDAWRQLVKFIEDYGHDLFTQSFLNLSNLRAILHCGTDNWLKQLEEHDEDPPFRLLRELDRTLPRNTAVEHLTLIIEAVVENYSEYRDYNSTTTQSDQGELLYMLLDFLRLKSTYDRVAWNLRPIVISHQVLVGNGRNEAAQIWRRALNERIAEEARRYLSKLQRLQRKYAMRMASVADRLQERFVRPMTIDRMRALLRLAMEQVNRPGPHHAFEVLEEEAALLMREPAGPGLEVPGWLAALEDEVDKIDHPRARRDPGPAGEWLWPRVSLTWEEIQQEIDAM